jgi:uncharacterized protein (TIGR02145 family)
MSLLPHQTFLSLLLAIAFTLSCSSGGGSGDAGISSSSSGGGISSPSSSSSWGGNAAGGSDGSCNIEDYRTIVIGTQNWLAENLNCNVPDSKCYNNDPTNCATYGRLYDWATAMALPSSCNTSSCSSRINAKHQGVCPSGWHIPSNADWNVLMKFVNPSCSNNNNCADAGTKLKATSGWNDYSSSSGNGTDAHYFAALPGGGGSPNGSFSSVSANGYWWSTMEDYDYAIYAYHRRIYYSSALVHWSLNDKIVFYSVRCLQD